MTNSRRSTMPAIWTGGSWPIRQSRRSSARLELILFGTSIVGFRLFSTIAVSLIIVLTGLMARELGGKRPVQLLAAIASGIAPVSVIQGAVFQYVSFDYLWGVTVTYFLIRLLKSDDPRWWVAIGTVLGLGMETRYTMGFLALGIAVAGPCLTPARRFLRSGWLWLGVSISILACLPNVIWQAQRHFISRDFLSYLHARDLRQGRYAGFYSQQLWVCVNVVTAPLTLMGLWFYFFRHEARRYRLLGWIFAVAFLLFCVVGARSYYTAPLYPMLIAGGSVLFGTLLDRVRPAWSLSAYGVQWTAIVVNGVICVLLFTPIAPIGSRISESYQQVTRSISRRGWLARFGTRCGGRLSLITSSGERANGNSTQGTTAKPALSTCMVHELGLPRAMSLTNSFWYRGYDPREPQTVIVVGFDLDEGRELFENCEIAAKNTNPFGVENEESRDHPDILLCRNLRMPWPVYWAHFRRFG